MPETKSAMAELAAVLADLLTLALLKDLEVELRRQATRRIMAAADAERAPKGVGPAVTIPRE